MVTLSKIIRIPNCNCYVNRYFTLTAEIHARSLANFYCQYGDRQMNLKFMRRVSERERAIRQFVIFLCVCPDIDNEFRHDNCQSSLRIHSAFASHRYFDNVMTKFMINNRTFKSLHEWSALSHMASSSHVKCIEI